MVPDNSAYFMHSYIFNIYHTENMSEETIEIIKKYWLLDDTKEYFSFKYKANFLSSEHGLSLSQFRKQYLSRVLKVEATAEPSLIGYFCCDVCSKPYEFQTRTEFLEFSHNRDRYLKNGQCNTCRSQTVPLTFKLPITTDKSANNTKLQQFEYKSLSLIHACYLQSWLLTSDECTSFTSSLITAELVHADTAQALTCLNELCGLGVIKLITKNHGNNIWALALPTDKNIETSQLITFLDEIIIEKSKSQKQEIMQLWEAVTIAESIKYLKDQLEAYQFQNLKIRSTPLHSALGYALLYFSIGQVKNIIWRSVKHAASLCQRIDYTPMHAINTIPGNIKKNVDKALAESWTINSFGKNSTETDPLLTSILFNKVLAIGGEGYKSTNKKDILQLLNIDGQ